MKFVPLFPNLKSFYEDYEMPLAWAFHEIDRRGVLVDQSRLDDFKAHVKRELDDACQKIEAVVNMPVIAKARKGVKTPAGTLNLSSVPGLRNVITNVLKIKLKKKWQSEEESTGEEALNEAYAKTGNPVLKEILRTRELNKIHGTYAEATLLDSVLYTSYSVTGTKTGRRSSRETPFTAANGHQIGTNIQNLPKQSELGKLFRGCLVARPGRIFLSCDQVQAEDWIVCAIIAAISGSTKGLDELRTGVDRHKRLAAQIFSKTEAECSKGTMFRYMGKKTRHAGNYGMRAAMMSSSLAKEGFSLTERYCEVLLDRFHNFEPEIRGSFQKTVEDSLRNERYLTTPVGRGMYFFGLRPNSDNSKIFKEGFAYIPQSTVGDNTGLGVLHCERVSPGWVIMDTHDSITLEVEDNEDSILAGIDLLTNSFDRTFDFGNGIVIKIPVDFELGYDLKNELEFSPSKCENVRTGLQSTLNTLRQLPRVPLVTTSGAPQQPSQVF